MPLNLVARLVPRSRAESIVWILIQVLATTVQPVPLSSQREQVSNIASQRKSLARNPLVMKNKALIFLQYLLIFTFALWFARPVSAHGGEPRLEISVERVNPGGVVDLRGVEFDYEQSVTLYLERTGIVVQLGEVVTDLEGVFIYFAVLPVDLPEGVYNVRAETTHHSVLSPALTVQGPPILGEGGGQGQRDEADPLLAPMPTFAPGVVPGGVLQPTAATASQQVLLETVAATNWNAIYLISIILFSIGIVVWFSRRFSRRA